MKPELELCKDKSFICPLNIDVGNLNSCHPVPCCGKFLHKHCFEGQPHGIVYTDTILTRRKKGTFCDSYMKYLKKLLARKQTTDRIKTRDRSSIFISPSWKRDWTRAAEGMKEGWTRDRRTKTIDAREKSWRQHMTWDKQSFGISAFTDVIDTWLQFHVDRVLQSDCQELGLPNFSQFLISSN